MLPEEGVITQSAGSARLGPQPPSCFHRTFGPEDNSGREKSDLSEFHRCLHRDACCLEAAFGTSFSLNWCDGYTEAMHLEA